MKALTLTQPWAQLVALGHKSIETRSWSTKYRGPLAIHAARGFPRAARELAAEERAIGRLSRDRLPLGGIVAIAWLVDVKRVEEAQPTPLERHLGDYSPGRYAWILDRDRLRVLAAPLEWTGRLGLWDVPDDYRWLGRPPVRGAVER